MSTTFVYGTPFAGHVPQIHAVGWGEPQTIYTTCSCGWEGVVINEKWFQDDEKEFSYFAEPWATVARTWGPEQALPVGQVFGTHATAEIQVLAHLNYDPEADRKQSRDAFEAATKLMLAATTEHEAWEARRAVDKAANELADAVEREAIWHREKLPMAQPRVPEALEILRAHKEEQDRKHEEAANKPLTRKEKRALREAGVQVD